MSTRERYLREFAPGSSGTCVEDHRIKMFFTKGICSLLMCKHEHDKVDEYSVKF